MKLWMRLATVATVLWSAGVIYQNSEDMMASIDAAAYQDKKADEFIRRCDDLRKDDPKFTESLCGVNYHDNTYQERERDAIRE